MMRISKLLLTSVVTLATIGAAQAADVIYDEPAAPIITAMPFTWTGAYVGVIGGAATGDNDFTAAYSAFNDAIIDEAGGLSLNTSGLFIGAQAGYDFQLANGVVIGAVADISYTDVKADLGAGLTALGNVSAESELKYLGTVRARLGYAVDRFLPYIHGGFAYGETEQTLRADGLGSVTFDGGDTKMGYTVGGGVEYAVTDNVSIQTEYGFTDLGDDTIYNGPLFGGDRLTVEEDLQFHTVKAGINFRF